MLHYPCTIHSYANNTQPFRSWLSAAVEIDGQLRQLLVHTRRDAHASTHSHRTNIPQPTLTAEHGPCPPIHCKPVMFTQVALGTLRITAVLSVWWPHSMGLTHWPAQGSNVQLRCCYSSSAAQPATTCAGDTPIDAAGSCTVPTCGPNEECVAAADSCWCLR